MGDFKATEALFHPQTERTNTGKQVEDRQRMLLDVRQVRFE